MDKIVILDFGGQYAHLIANRIRRLNVYSEILAGDTPAKEIVKNLAEFKGLILSGGPSSVNDESGLMADPEIFKLGIPILGLCYGHQIIAKQFGGRVEQGKVREYGYAEVKIFEPGRLFNGLKNQEKVWMSHFDQVVEAPLGFKIMGQSEDCLVAAMGNENLRIFGIQFHPEVSHTACGMKILENFIQLTGAANEWNTDQYIEEILVEIRAKAQDKKVFLMISGGVDSSVAYLLLAKALGQERVYALFVDTGFMRKHEREEVEQGLQKVGVNNLHIYDASEEFFTSLAGISEPEAKRKIIGELFLKIQEKVSGQLKLNSSDWILAQGTIYPDTIETGGTRHSHKIKTHHNRVAAVQQLIEAGRVIEPLHQLYKDEVRKVGTMLGLNEEMVYRQPFPGPGLAVRCLCAEKEDYPEQLGELERRMNQVSTEFGLDVKVMPIKSVGVQGDERTYKHPAVLFKRYDLGESLARTRTRTRTRPTLKNLDPGLPRINWELINKLATRLTNQFPAINRVIYGVLNFDYQKLTFMKGLITKSRITLLQDCDKIVMNFLDEKKIQREIWQFATVLIPVTLDGKQESIVLRPVESQEAMTANFYPMDFALLDELAKRIIETQQISGIFYDVTNKPPGTIEWE